MTRYKIETVIIIGNGRVTARILSFRGGAGNKRERGEARKYGHLASTSEQKCNSKRHPQRTSFYVYYFRGVLP